VVPVDVLEGARLAEARDFEALYKTICTST
jgi:hypothetical protein